MRVLKAFIRPVVALLASGMGAGVTGVLTTICVTWTNIKGALAILIFGLMLGVPGYLPITLSRALPVFVLCWLPLWLGRVRWPSFWRWSVAPLVGGGLAYLSWIVTNHFWPVFGEDYKHHELIVAAHVGAAAGGFAMFAVGCRWRRRKSGGDAVMAQLTMHPRVQP